MVMVVRSYVRVRLGDWRYRDVRAAEFESLVHISSVHKSSEDIVPVTSLLLNERIRQGRHC